MQSVFVLISLFSLIFVNGFTDAPNSISCAVASGALPFRKAKRLAAVFDALGVICFGFAFPTVAKTSSEIASFDGNVNAALAAGMLSAVIFALAAWLFGIPTSESHGMSAAIAGAAFFSGGKVGTRAFLIIFMGLWASTVISPIISRLIYISIRNGKMTRKAAGRLEASLAALSAFLHGAQDGQKFLGLLMLIFSLEAPRASGIFSVALVISLGTLMSTERIVRKVASETVRPNAEGGAAADLSALLSMLLFTLLGIPVSTSSIKVSSLMGVGGSESNFSSFFGMAAVWILTFPVCFLLGGGLYKLISLII